MAKFLEGVPTRDTFRGRLVTCSFSKYRLHGDISSVTYMVAHFKFLTLVNFFLISWRLCLICAKRRKNCGRNMSYTGIFRKAINLVSLRVVFEDTKTAFLQFLSLEMCPTRAHFEDTVKHSETCT